MLGTGVKETGWPGEDRRGRAGTGHFEVGGQGRKGCRRVGIFVSAGVGGQEDSGSPVIDQGGPGKPPELLAIVLLLLFLAMT